MILTVEQGVGFLVAALLITLAPGPDNLMVLSVGIAKGRRQGMLFGLGCALGSITHTLLAALGISALIASSSIAFLLLKVVGGGYLIYIGWQAIRRKNTEANTDTLVPNITDAIYFRRGLFANTVNPKVILFFLAFLPQFVNPANGQVGIQILLLGLIFSAQAALLFGSLGYFSGTIGQWLNKKPATAVWLDRIAGGIFILLGARLMLLARHMGQP